MSIAIDLLIMVTLLVIGVPVPFCFAGAILYLVWTTGCDPSFLLPVGFAKLNSVTLLAILFFIMVGSMMASGGLAKRLLDFADAFVGRLRGGLGLVSIVTCALFGAISGTCSSAVAAVGTIMIPRMTKDGYPIGYSSALVSCSSILGQLIPPSVPMILFAWVTEQSVTACFLSTVGPGIVLIIVFGIINYVMVGRMPSVKKREPVKNTGELIVLVKNRTKQATLALLMPIIVLGSIYGGIATPTEAAGMALLYAIPISMWVYREIDFKKAGKIISDSVTTSGVIILMLFFVMVLSRIFTIERVPQLISDALLGVSDNKIIVLLLVNLFLIIVGMLMDDISGTVLAAPLLMPVMQHLGIHPIHFAAIMGVNLGLGNITPPCAPILYLGCRVGGVKFEKVLKPTLILIIFGLIPVLLITTYLPDLSLILPRLLLGIK